MLSLCCAGAGRADGGEGVGDGQRGDVAGQAGAAPPRLPRRGGAQAGAARRPPGKRVHQIWMDAIDVWINRGKIECLCRYVGH